MKEVLVAVGLPLTVGALGAAVTQRNVTTWYASLDKPSWTPPSRLFGPVWTLLYILMGVSSWMVWKEVGLASVPMALYVVQLVLNGIWSPVFFGLKSIPSALATILALDLALVATIIAFWRVNPSAALLLLPYALWTAYATALTRSLYVRNASKR